MEMLTQMQTLTFYQSNQKVCLIMIKMLCFLVFIKIRRKYFVWNFFLLLVLVTVMMDVYRVKNGNRNIFISLRQFISKK
jgi:hypothetical protein